MCATEPRSIASTRLSIWRGEISRSKNQADEQSAKRSSSVTLNGVFAESSPSTRGCVELRLTRERTARALELPLAKNVVERADRAREQRAGAQQQIALDPVDVRSVRDDQERILVDRREVSL